MAHLSDDKTVAKMGHPALMVRLDVGHRSSIPAGRRQSQDRQAFQLGTVRTMFHIIWSRAELISSEGSVRVLHRAAQQKPVGVRTMMVVVPGRLPLCHQFPAPLLRTIQPRA